MLSSVIDTACPTTHDAPCGCHRPGRARRDNAFGWYAENYSREFAVRWYDGLARAIRSLRENPLRCATAHENDKFSFEVRELRFGGRRHKHRILFTVEDEVVLVLHIRHSAQRELTEDDF